jgi:hypothetical protein
MHLHSQDLPDQPSLRRERSATQRLLLRLLPLLAQWHQQLQEHHAAQAGQEGSLTIWSQSQPSDV